MVRRPDRPLNPTELSALGLDVGRFVGAKTPDGDLLIACLRCPACWTHPMRELSVGTRLHLLNHAAGHERKAKKAKKTSGATE